MKKFCTLTFIMLLAISMSAQRITSVWSGNHDFPEKDGWQEVAAEKFASLQLGDYIMVTVSYEGSGDHQINLAGKDPWTEVPGTKWGGVEIGKTLYQINDEDLLASIKNSGLGVQGKNYTLTDISIVDATNLTSVWTGNYNFPENNGWQSVEADKFTKFQLGDYLMVTVSAITNPDGWAQIALAGNESGNWKQVPGANWNGIKVGKMLFQINDQDVLSSIQAGGLAVQGRYYTLTDISIFPDNRYTRSVTNDGFGTICLPYASSTISGATIYSIAGLTAGGVVLEEESSMVAGTPYIFKANSDLLEVTYTGSRADVKTATGLVGNLSASPLPVPEGSYIIKSDNKLHRVPAGTNVTVGQNRAYIDLNGLEEITSVQGRTVMAVENVSTGLESISGEIRCHKVVRNGQILILNEDGIYNMLGQKIQ